MNSPKPRLWKNRNYRLLFSASAISNLGDGVAILAYPWLATLISRDPMHIAFVAFASRLPWFLLTLPAGVITDRLSHRKIMIWADVFRFVLTLAVVSLVVLGPELPGDTPNGAMILLLALAAFLLGSAEVLRDNTAQTILPGLVEDDDLPAANGQMWSAEQVIGQFIGPPLAGFLIALALPLPFVLDAVSFALAAGLVFYLKPRPVMPTPHKPAWAAMKEGLVWIRKRPLLVRLAVMTGLMNLGATISLTILVLFAQDIFDLGAAGYGLLLTSGALGGAIGGLVAPRIVAWIGQGWGLRISVGFIALESLLMGLANHVFFIALGLFLGVFGGMIWNVIAVPLRQRIVPPELLGRVNSVYRFVSWGTVPIGAILSGVLVTGFEVFTSHETALRLPYILVGGGFCLLTLYTFRKFSNASLKAGATQAIGA
ncbi:MAG: MFS transporter [Paracoccaceae bacterium]